MKKTNLLFAILFCFISLFINAQTWNPAGTGMNNDIYALAADTANNNLYAAGKFTSADGSTANYIAKWDGTKWSPLGTGVNNHIFSLAIYKGDLYAGGQFTTAGGNSATGIAKWNGTTWSAVGTGINTQGKVLTLAVYNGELYAGGNFTTAGGNTANHIAKWNGTKWFAVGTGMNNAVRVLTVHKGSLYAGGQFTTAGGNTANHIAKWNGTTWSAVGAGINNVVYALASDSSNNRIYAGGYFSDTSGTNVAMWNGVTWSAMGTGINNIVSVMAMYNGTLYAGGNFTFASGNAAANIAKWNGTNWSAVSSGTNGHVDAMVLYNDELYAGGYFTTAGGNVANRIAKWSALPPAASFTANNTTICVNTPVNFINQSTGTSVSWAFPGGTPDSSTASNPVVSYAKAGTYDVTLITTNGNSSDTLTVANYITVRALPSIKTTEDISICSGSGTNLNTYFTLSNSTTFPIPDTNATGINSTINVSGSDSASSVVYVRIDSLSHTSASDLSITLIAPNGSSIDLSSGNGGSDNDYTSTMFTSSASSSITSGTAPFTGSFTPEQAFSNLSGSANGTWTLNIVDNTAKDTGILYKWTLVIPSQDSNLTYLWAPSIGLNDTAISNPLSSPARTTTYTVTVTDTNACSSVDYVTITVKDTTGIGCTKDTVKICSGSSTQLSAEGGISYLWVPSANLNDTTAASPVANPTDTTDYMVTITTANGCVFFDSVRVNVTTDTLPVANASTDTMICAGNSIAIKVFDQAGDSTYSWSPSTGLSATTGASVNASPSITTNYIVTVVNKKGCTNNDTIKITVKPLPVAPVITSALDSNKYVLSSDTSNNQQWYFNGVIIQGATAQTYTATKSGDYKVVVTDTSGCSASSNVLNITYTGTIENTAENSLAVFPNPNSGNFELSFNAFYEDNYDIEFTNAIGQIVYKENLKGFSGSYRKQIDLSAYGKGIYFFTLKSNDNQAVRKVVTY